MGFDDTITYLVQYHFDSSRGGAPPWVVIGWMLIGIGVALLQAVHNHELLYPRFWKTFWRLSDLYWLFGFAACFLLTIS